jgi:uncharacterized protein YbjQ (UPF0145 family)
MPSHNEIKEWVERERAVRAERARPVMMTAVADGIRARQVTEHPGWEMYVQKLAALQDAAEQAARAGADAMVNAKDDASERAARGMALRADGARGAFIQALSLIPDILRAADKARAELSS